MNLGDGPWRRTGAGSGAAWKSSPVRAHAAEAGRQLAGASGLCGDSIVNLKDETLGTVSEILLDIGIGRIAYAVMATGGFMGMGERLYAIPWRALSVDRVRHCLVLDGDAALLDRAPDFDKEHWPLQPEAAWHERIHRHFGVPLYWE
jgi:hypothetical protein